MARKTERTYQKHEREIALIIYERNKHKMSVKDIAVQAAVEEVDLRRWIEGGPLHAELPPVPPDEEEGDGGGEWQAPAGIPMPPEHLTSPLRTPDDFRDAKDLAAWVRRHFIDEDGEVCNPDHWHLRAAILAFEWTNIEQGRQMKRVAAQCRMIGASGGNKWQTGKEEVLLKRAWGQVPHFLITIDAVWWATASDASRCAVIDHELYHAGLKRNKYGEPVIGKKGPEYAVRGHDCEEFVGVVARWGIGAAAAGAAELVKAAGRRPLISEARIASLCGNCLR